MVLNQFVEFRGVFFGYFGPEMHTPDNILVQNHAKSSIKVLRKFSQTETSDFTCQIRQVDSLSTEHGLLRKYLSVAKIHREYVMGLLYGLQNETDHVAFERDALERHKCELTASLIIHSPKN